jgi:hypothetical protein
MSWSAATQSHLIIANADDRLQVHSHLSESLVRHLAEAIEVNYAFVAE